MKRLASYVITMLVPGFVAPATVLGVDDQIYHNRYKDPSFGGNIILPGAPSGWRQER